MSRYWLESRSNATLTVIDEVSDFEELTVRLRFNGLSTWTLTLRRESLYAPTFLPDVNKALNNGILLWFDPEDGITAPILLLSGPQDTYELSRKEDGTGVLLVNGFDDNAFLQWHLALPVPNYPYLTSWPKGAYYPPNIAGPVRFFPLNEASGTVATDLSDAPSNGTYAGTIGFGQPGLIDDPSTCVKMDGATTEVQVNTTGLASGNAAWICGGWGMLSAYPPADAYMWSFGTNAATKGVGLSVTSNGFPKIIALGGTGSQTGTTVVPLNQPFFLGMLYDGSAFSGFCYASNQQDIFGTFTPGTLVITYGLARIGDLLGVSNFWPGWLGMCFFYNFAVALNLANRQNMYLTGLSRQAFFAFDNNAANASFSSTGRAFAAGSTGLLYYVQRNASASALPATSFTTATGTHRARPVPGLVLASDPAVGGTTYAAARFDKLLILLAALALQASPELGFKLQQVGQQLVFSVFQPADKTSTAVFSLDLGNLRSYTWQYGRSQANYLFTGGLNPSTSLTSRIFGEAGDAAGIAQFGLIEDFYDYRKTSDAVTLANVMAAKLAEVRAKRNINAAINDTTNLYFGGPGNKGYNLGDKVRVIMEDGSIYDDLVREVNIALVKGQPAKVLAAIGTPIDAAIIAEWDQILKRFKNDGINIGGLQNNY